MRRGPFMLLLAAALALTGALPAEAAKRIAPKGFYGAMWNRAGTEVPPAEHDAEFALMARSGVETVRTVFDWSRAQPAPGVTSFTRDRPPGHPRRGPPHRPAAGGDLQPGLGGRVRGQSRFTAARGVRLRGLPHPARGAVRPEGQLLARAPRAAEDTHPPLADLERAPPREVLVRGGRLDLVERVHAAPQGGARRDQAGRPGRHRGHRRPGQLPVEVPRRDLPAGGRSGVRCGGHQLLHRQSQERDPRRAPHRQDAAQPPPGRARRSGSPRSPGPPRRVRRRAPCALPGSTGGRPRPRARPRASPSSTSAPCGCAGATASVACTGTRGPPSTRATTSSTTAGCCAGTARPSSPSPRSRPT